MIIVSSSVNIINQIMLKKLITTTILFITAFLSYAQVKIGADIDTIDEFSILELDSNSLALVLTRVTDQEMAAITPLQGAIVYNTDAKCIHYFDGANWNNLCATSAGNQIRFTDNNDGTFTITNGDGTSFTSIDLTGPQGIQGEKGDIGDTGPQGIPGNSAQQEQIVITANNGQTQFTTPVPIVDDNNVQVYRNGVRIAFTALDENTIQLENDIVCYQNDRIRIVQIF